MKSHMKHPVRLAHSRCGKPFGAPHRPNMISWPYGSPKATCKMCHRLYFQDLNIVDCNGCKDAPLDIHDIEKTCDVCTEHALDVMNNGGDE